MQTKQWIKEMTLTEKPEKEKRAGGREGMSQRDLEEYAVRESKKRWRPLVQWAQSFCE